MSDIAHKKTERRCKNIQQLLLKQTDIKPGTLVKSKLDLYASPEDELDMPNGDSNKGFVLPEGTVLMFIAVVPDLDFNSPVFKFLYNESFIIIGPLTYYQINKANKEQAQSVQKFCFSFEKVS